MFQGIQFFTDVTDDDGPPGFSGLDQLVDNFSIVLNTTFLIPGAVFTERTVHNGNFGFGQFELSFRVSCAANFFGPNCATDCVHQCDLNGECTDEINTFTCECNAGFTGADCMTDINDCEGMNCGNGVCWDTGVTSFTCECNVGFTGADCMTNIDDCASANCSENSQCVDGVDSFSCVCSPGFKFNGTFCENAASQGTHIQSLSLKSVCASNDSVFVFR